MSSPPFRIISGGQTGVDRAALDAALTLGVPSGGWCPAGRLDEDGIIPARYPVREMEKGGYFARTIQNLVDADGTLILYFGDLEGGTGETLFRCIKLKRPYCLLDASELTISRAVEKAISFIQSRSIRSLNAAGPRASKKPEAYAYALEVVTGIV